MYADPSDRATQTEELFRATAIQNAKAERRRPKGSCYNCDEPLTGEALFCDAECGIDFEKRTRK